MTLCRQCDEEHDSLYAPPPCSAHTGPALNKVRGCWPEMDGCYTMIEWDDAMRPTALAFYSATGWMIDYVPWEG